MTPEPSSTAGTSATWNADADLEGFELVADATANEDDTSADDTATDGDGAGFGVVVPLVALLVAALLSARGDSLDE